MSLKAIIEIIGRYSNNTLMPYVLFQKKTNKIFLTNVVNYLGNWLILHAKFQGLTRRP